MSTPRRAIHFLLPSSMAVLLAIGPFAFSQKDERRPARDSGAQKQVTPRGDQQSNRNTGPATLRGTTPVSLVMTPGREAAAIKFAQIHHPELERLLTYLQDSNPAEYKQAVRKLYQDSERLARLAERAPDRHEMELQAWKLESRIRLLAARMSMSGDEEMKSRLDRLLNQRVDLRLRQLQAERERVAARLDKLNETIEQLESDPQAAADKDLQRVRRSLGISSSRAKDEASPAPKRPANSPRSRERKPSNPPQT